MEIIKSYLRTMSQKIQTTNTHWTVGDVQQWGDAWKEAHGESHHPFAIVRDHQDAKYSRPDRAKYLQFTVTIYDGTHYWGESIVLRFTDVATIKQQMVDYITRQCPEMPEGLVVNWLIHVHHLGTVYDVPCSHKDTKQEYPYGRYRGDVLTRCNDCGKQINFQWTGD